MTTRVRKNAALAPGKAKASTHLNIVVFDNSPDIREEYEEAFRGKPVRVHVFEHAQVDETVCAQILAFRTDLIVLELMAAGSPEAGLRFMQRIASTEALSALPVVVCSRVVLNSPHGREIRRRCASLGAKGVFGTIPGLPSYTEIKMCLGSR